MKLSEAIRLGSLMKPQAFTSSSHVGSCALRAAAEAVGLQGMKWDGIPYSDLGKCFPMLNDAATCPVCACPQPGVVDVLSVIFHLNDRHRWTRERIADFVELHEPLPDSSLPGALEVAEVDRGK